MRVAQHPLAEYLGLESAGRGGWEPQRLVGGEGRGYSPLYECSPVNQSDPE